MAAPTPNNAFRVRRYVEARDGDTPVLAMVYPGLPPVELAYRLRGIDCPELKDPGGAEAKAATHGWLAGARKIVVQSHGLSFDRVVADMWVDDVLLQDLLLAGGFAAIYRTAPAGLLPASMLPRARASGR